MPKGLTPQQRLFAVEVASGKTARDAAIAAGYAPNNADSQASRLVRKSQVSAEIARIQAKATASCMGSKQECLDMLWSQIVAAQQESDRSGLKGLSELWLKASGHLIERREIRQDTVCEIDWSSTDAGGTDAN